MHRRHAMRQALDDTRILRPPKHQLSTFGTTTLRYVLLSVPSEQPEHCRVREGTVTAERPQILTPDMMRERFSGFGADAGDYAEHLSRLYGDLLRALEYRFRNDLQGTTLEHSPLADITERARRQMDRDDAPRTALLQGPDRHWSLSVMKFIVDMTLQSFPGNVREMDERGLFDPDGRRDARARSEIERLFAEAVRDRRRIEALGSALRRSGLFAEYEDRFFNVVKG